MDKKHFKNYYHKIENGKGTNCRSGFNSQLVRSILYMATLFAARYNPVIKRFYDRLIQAGKVLKVAITACMRKLLTIPNAIIRYVRPWIIQNSKEY